MANAEIGRERRGESGNRAGHKGMGNSGYQSYREHAGQP